MAEVRGERGERGGVRSRHASGERRIVCRTKMEDVERVIETF